MQDFAAELRAAREPLQDDGPRDAGAPAGGFEGYLVSRAIHHGFELGHETGERVAAQRFGEQLVRVREESRLAGFDAGVRVLLVNTLQGLQEVVGELESRRAHKVMLVNAREKLGMLVEQLGSVQDVLSSPAAERSGQMPLGPLATAAAAFNSTMGAS